VRRVTVVGCLQVDVNKLEKFMRISLRQTVLTLYVLIFVVSATFSGAVYWQGQAAVKATRLLVDDDIPTLRTLADLKTDVAALEPIVYQYYVRLDRETFLSRKAATEDSIERGLTAIRAAFPQDQRLAKIDAQYAPIKSLVERLGKVLNTRPINREQASFLLAGISSLCIDINRNVEMLAEAIHQGVSKRGAVAQRSIEGIARQVAFFSALLFIVALIGGYYARGYLVEGAARRRLTMFPERDPNPVFSLAEDGAVRYANPGAMETLQRLGAPGSRPAALLPDDLAHRLATLKASGGDQVSWEYAALGRIFGCAIHYLEDYREFHAYMSDITERKRAEEQLVYLAYHDALTGLPNRRRFLERLDEASGDADGGKTAIILLSLDRFKLVTESLGQAAGDRLLVAAAQRLGQLIEAGGESGGNMSLYRFDGDLFAILAAGAASSTVPALFAARLSASMEAPLMVEGRELFGTFSIGVAVFPDDGMDADALMKNAESALHRVIQDGGNGFRCCSREMSALALERLEMEAALRQALAHEQLEVHYQLQVEIASGRLVGVEALVRWRHPRRGMVSPGEFIPLAEETGLIIPLGEWVLRTACTQNQAWQAAGWPAMTVAVNISARQFRGNHLPEVLARVLQETGLEPQYLELEVTESVAMQEVEATIAALRELKAIGVSLSIDDFGTGYSSLAYLKRFPLDKLKVDQSFVRQMVSEASDAAIVQAVIALGHALQLKVIAEGVETEAQLARLKDYGCEEMQGFLFSRPVPAGEIALLLAQHSGSPSRA
jgi:diguanylate cyclase (GGDEF)-like protein